MVVLGDLPHRAGQLINADTPLFLSKPVLTWTEAANGHYCKHITEFPVGDREALSTQLFVAIYSTAFQIEVNGIFSNKSIFRSVRNYMGSTSELT